MREPVTMANSWLVRHGDDKYFEIAAEMRASGLRRRTRRRSAIIHPVCINCAAAMVAVSTNRERERERARKKGGEERKRRRGNRHERKKEERKGEARTRGMTGNGGSAPRRAPVEWGHVGDSNGRSRAYKHVE